MSIVFPITTAFKNTTMNRANIVCGAILGSGSPIALGKSIAVLTQV
jgi:hypothetical protein